LAFSLALSGWSQVEKLHCGTNEALASNIEIYSQCGWGEIHGTRTHVEPTPNQPEGIEVVKFSIEPVNIVVASYDLHMRDVAEQRRGGHNETCRCNRLLDLLATIVENTDLLSLAFNAGKLSRIPKLEMLAENNVRESFLEHGSFINLLSNLPEPVAELVEFEYLCGWRQGAAKKLEWKDIDRGSGEWVAYLRIGNSKNKDQWMLPLTGRLREIIEGRMAKRRLDCPYVFHRSGRPIKDFRVSWATACKKVGLVGGRAGVIPHDLRSCAARNLQGRSPGAGSNENHRT
jgi:integrase